jgi:RNA polymerase sigma factor (sigma-70 family)
MKKYLDKEDFLDVVDFIDTVETVSIEEAYDIASDETSAEDIVSMNDLKRTVTKVLSTLTAEEERILRKRFAFYRDTEYTLKEIAEEFSITRDRVRQIEAKALRKLKAPSRARKFYSFIAA